MNHFKLNCQIASIARCRCVTMDDKALVSEIIKGNQKAFRALYDKYAQMVFTTAIGFVKDTGFAQDIMQEVFVDVLSSIKKFKGESKLSTWLYRIAINKSLNYLRDNRNYLTLIKSSTSNDSYSVLTESRTEEQASPLKKIEHEEMAKVLHSAINNLPEKQRIAFVLCKYNDMSYTEIAETMQLSVSSVESLLFRARKGLQKSLVKFYKNI